MDHADIKPMVPPPPTSREHQAVMNAIYSLLPDLQARIDAAMGRPTPLRCDFNTLIRNCTTSAQREALVLALTTASSFPTRHPPLLEQMTEAIEEACLDPDVRQDMCTSICEIHVEAVDPARGSKAITWVTQPLPALVYAGTFAAGRAGGFSRAEWRDFFEDVFHARERMLVGQFQRVALPQLQARARELLGRPLAIDVDLTAMVGSCDRQTRLALVQTLCTDTGKRRQLRRAEQASRQLFDEAKHLATAVGAQIAERSSKHAAASADSIQMAPIEDMPSPSDGEGGPAGSVADPPAHTPAASAVSAPGSAFVPSSGPDATVVATNAARALASPPGDDDDDQFFDSSDVVLVDAQAPGASGAAAASVNGTPTEVDRFARVTKHLLREPTHSPNVLTPLLNMMAWAVACDALNRSVLADGVSRIVVKCVPGSAVEKKSLRLLTPTGDIVPPSTGLLAPSPRDCTLEYSAVLAAGFRGCFANTELYNFLEAHFHCHERALVTQFHTSMLPAESLRLSVALGQPLPIELAWETLLPTTVPLAQRIEALKVMCSNFFLPTIVDAIVSVLKTNAEAKDIMSAILQRVVIRGTPTRAKPVLQLLPMSAPLGVSISSSSISPAAQRPLQTPHTGPLTMPLTPAHSHGGEEGQTTSPPATNEPLSTTDSAAASATTTDQGGKSQPSLASGHPVATAGAAANGHDDLPQSQLVFTYYLLAGPRGCFDGEDIKENLRRVLSLSTPESERGLGRVGRRLGREAHLVAADISRIGQRLSSSFSKWLNS